MLAAAAHLGYDTSGKDSGYRDLVLEVFLIALEPLQVEGPYDFGTSTMPRRLSELAERVTEFREFWHAPPSDAVFFHRKLGGMFLLASRLEARVDVRELVSRFI